MNKLEVLYEDNHIIVVNKPCNILSQADITKDIDLLSIVKKYIKEKYNKKGNVYIGLIHRLDRPVSGIMVFARTSKAASRLSLMMQKKEFKKYYLAVVHGIIKEEEGEFIDYLKKEDNGNTIVTTKDRGKKAVLRYKVLRRNIKKQETLISIELLTGRHHQIRVQFATRGYPLCGDQRYGKRDKTQLALCSYKTSFMHPVKNELMTFQVEYPKRKYFNDFTL